MHALPPVHVLIPTHTTRHLAACLAGLAWQTTTPDSVTVSCDTDDPAIGELLAEVWPRVCDRIRTTPGTAPTLLYVSRPHGGGARLNQVRNNGLRALARGVLLRDGRAARDNRRGDVSDRRGPPIGQKPDGMILVLDGDTILAPRSVEAHAAAAARGHEVLIPYRVNLSEALTNRISAESLLATPPGTDPASEWMTDSDHRALAARQRRYERQLLLRRLSGGSLVKQHKPKALGGHHAVSLAALRAINGYDEEYVGYGYDDDDLTRRLYQLRPRPRVAILVKSALAFHLWHPSRAPARPTEAPGFARFQRRNLPTAAMHGWEHPLPQPEPRAIVIPNESRRVSAGPAAEHPVRH